MGVSVSVDVEGESSVPVRERTDGKHLADIVGGLIWVPQIVTLLDLPSNTTKALKMIEESAYGEPERDVWQSPTILKIALEETQKAFQKARSSPSLIDELEAVRSGSTFYRDELDGYDLGIEDAINICDWAIKRNKRVRLRAW